MRQRRCARLHAAGVRVDRRRRLDLRLHRASVVGGRRGLRRLRLPPRDHPALADGGLLRRRLVRHNPAVPEVRHCAGGPRRRRGGVVRHLLCLLQLVFAGPTLPRRTSVPHGSIPPRARCSFNLLLSRAASLPRPRLRWLPARVPAPPPLLPRAASRWRTIIRFIHAAAVTGNVPYPLAIYILGLLSGFGHSSGNGFGHSSGIGLAPNPKRGGFCGVLGEIGCRAANLAENTGNMGNCLFWRAHLGTSVPAISGLSGPGGSVGSPASGQTGWESLGARWILPCGPMSSPLKR